MVLFKKCVTKIRHKPFTTNINSHIIALMLDNKLPSNDYNLYYLQSHPHHMAAEIKSLRNMYGTDIINSYTIKQPNALLVWKHMEANYSKNIIKKSNSNWFKLNNISKYEFYNVIHKLELKNK